MKKALVFVWALFALLSHATAATLSAEQKEVQAFIKKLYAVDSLTFEFREISGKHDPKRVNREIYPQFFSKELLGSVKDVTGVDGAGYVRHPSASDEDLSQLTGRTVTKNPKMLSPVVNGESAYADVFPDNGRTIYFLKKTLDGWRIINTASYNIWPRNDGSCWEPFYLVAPTPEQQALETKECIKFRQSPMPKK